MLYITRYIRIYLRYRTYINNVVWHINIILFWMNQNHLWWQEARQLDLPQGSLQNAEEALRKRLQMRELKNLRSASTGDDETQLRNAIKEAERIIHRMGETTTSTTTELLTELLKTHQLHRWKWWNLRCQTVKLCNYECVTTINAYDLPLHDPQNRS